MTLLDWNLHLRWIIQMLCIMSDYQTSGSTRPFSNANTLDTVCKWLAAAALGLHVTCRRWDSNLQLTSTASILHLHLNNGEVEASMMLPLHSTVVHPGTLAGSVTVTQTISSDVVWAREDHKNTDVTIAVKTIPKIIRSKLTNELINTFLLYCTRSHYYRSKCII